MKCTRITGLACAAALIVNMSAIPAAAEDTDIFNTVFSSGSLSEWSNTDNISFYNDSLVGDYAVIDGNSAASAPLSQEFSAEGDIFVEFDMMLPSIKADGVSENGICGGFTCGLALMQGETVAGVIGYRGSGSGAADNILSMGGSGSDYLSAAGNKSSASKDKWMHYVLYVNTDTQSGDIYMTDPQTGDVYSHEGRFDKYISNISALTNIGVVSDKAFSIALANLRVYNPEPDRIELTAENDMDIQYIPGEGSVSTVSYSAEIYKSLYYNSGGAQVSADKEILLKNSSVSFSVSDAEGYAAENISISDNGLLEIGHDAAPGIYTVTAECGGLYASREIEILSAGLAAAAQITGAEEIISDETESFTYKLVPIADTGAILPEKEVEWSITGDAKGAVIDEHGVLTPGDAAGRITVKVTITENGLSAELDVHIRSSLEAESAPVEVMGMILYSKNTDINGSEATDIAIKSDCAISDASIIIKGFDSRGLCTAYSEQYIGSIDKAAYSIPLPEAVYLGDAQTAYVMVTDANGELVSKRTVLTDKGIYKGVPLAGDWHTNPDVGIGEGMNAGPPAGIDPETVNTSQHKVSYEYNDNYREITKDNILWYKTGAYDSSSTIYQQHSKDWEQQALPIGNGYMGAMIFGMPGKDQIQFNEETFWAGGYRGAQSPGAGTQTGSGTSYMNAGNIFVDFGMENGAKVTNYYRDLDLDEAVAHVEYTYNGVKYNREYFASYPAQSMIFRYTADQPGALTFDVNPVMAHPGSIRTENGEITIIGKLKDAEPYAGSGKVKYAQESDLEYCAKIKVIAEGGSVADDYAKISVNNADAVTIILTCATDYDPNRFIISDDGTVDVDAKQFKHANGVEYALSKAEERLSYTDGKTYDELKSEHTADYSSLYERVSFSLTDDDEICDIPTNQLLSSYSSVVSQTQDATGASKVTYDQQKYNELDKHAEELYYNFGRYMMIASSRENTLPANLQGKWCQSVSEIWGSGYTVNINLEMNYWFAGAADLSECAMALVGLLESQVAPGSITAKNQSGFTAKSYRLENGETVFEESDQPEDTVFAMNGLSPLGTTDSTGSASESCGNLAWLMQNVWNIYETTGDETLLRERLYPLMRYAANFYTQYMYSNKRETDDTEKYPNGYFYTTGKSRSPEQGPYQEGIYYDLQLVAGFFDYIIEAADILGVDGDKAEVWREIRENIKKPVELGTDGQIKEWEQETAYNRDSSGNAIGDDHHRHISHLVALYPGVLINRNTPELLDGARFVLEKRGDDSTGWSCSFKFLLWARTLDGNRALELFRYQIAKKTYSNMFNFHEPFQIDGNFGSCAGVHELLLQSDRNSIYLLPALPDVWDKGSISGLKSKNGSEVSVSWENGKPVSAEITPDSSGAVTLGFDAGGNDILVTDENGGTAIIKQTDGVYTLSLDAGVTYTVTPAETAEPYSVESVSKTENGCSISINKNGDFSSSDHMMYAASYRNGELTGIFAAELGSIAGNTAKYLTTLNPNDDIKVFFWDSSGSPLAAASEI